MSSSASATESSLLIPANNQDREGADSRGVFVQMMGFLGVVGSVGTVLAWTGRRPPPPPSALLSTTAHYNGGEYSHEQQNLFPQDFAWGAATSSYQIEGASAERGPTVWDTFVHQTPSPILDGSTADVACDHVHRFREDVSLLKELNIQAYRFSISWTRLLSTGTLDGGINPHGIGFYNSLIDLLVENGIEPYVTLFHWDTPDGLDWRDANTAKAFARYAEVAFEAFGDRVKHWITINEPWTVAVNGYNSAVHAPGHRNSTEAYLVAHNLLLGHCYATRAYRATFQEVQNGAIGVANCGDFRYPVNSQNPKDSLAAERSMLFQFGWFLDPLVFGDYPSVMRERVGDRLPKFTTEERLLLLSSKPDFVGLNYYSTLLASDSAESDCCDYWTDMGVDFSDNPKWRKNDMGWNVVPDGLFHMLQWVSRRYNNPTIFVTENGTAEREDKGPTPLHDTHRKNFLLGHLLACKRALDSGVQLKGYFAWSLMDNFASFYADTIKSHGETLYDSNRKLQVFNKNFSRESSRRPLPDPILMSYASRNFAAVRRAVQEGVNVVCWAFVDIVADSANKYRVETTLSLDYIRNIVKELDDAGFDHVVHLMSVGGWNGAHLDETLSAQEWYAGFLDLVGDVFHGIDWDLEGNDDLTSPYNQFSKTGLDMMGEISILAKRDGYSIGMAPPQSYLDIDQQGFSRLVNLTDDSREWHRDFSYFGLNVYAYVLSKYGPWIDIVSIQFYESYSRAGLAIYSQGISASSYLTEYVSALHGNRGLNVDFSQDPSVDIGPVFVPLPLSKVILGFANGWAATDDCKTLFVDADEVGVAWENLVRNRESPRGVMYWTIEEEGRNDIWYTRGLKNVLDKVEVSRSS